MSGWDAVRRLTLAEPWQDFWVDLYEDPPMGEWLAIQEKANEAASNPVPDAIDAAIRAFRPLIATHNITDREGQPMELTLQTLPSSLFAAILLAVRQALDGAGLPPTSAKRARSRGPSSPRPKSPRASNSGH